MSRSTERFLTTHTGSLPRPADLIRMMFAKEEGVPVDPAALAARVRAAVAEVVRKQAESGIDLINDGELSKPSYATYVKDRLAGFGGSGNTFVYQDLADFPSLEKRVFGDPGRSRRKTPACNAPISVRDPQAAVTDAANLKAALSGVPSRGGFRIAYGDRCVARRRLAPRAAGIAEHALGEIGEVGEVLIDEGVAGAAKAVEAILDVGRIARLRHLAVIDDVDAG